MAKAWSESERALMERTKGMWMGKEGVLCRGRFPTVVVVMEVEIGEDSFRVLAREAADVAKGEPREWRMALVSGGAGRVRMRNWEFPEERLWLSFYSASTAGVRERREEYGSEEEMAEMSGAGGAAGGNSRAKVWSARQRRQLEEAKEKCVGKEALLRSGPIRTIVRVEEMVIEEESFTARVKEVTEDNPRTWEVGSTPEAGSVNAGEWGFHYVGDYFNFDPRRIAMFRQDQIAKGEDPSRRREERVHYEGDGG